MNTWKVVFFAVLVLVSTQSWAQTLPTPQFGGTWLLILENVEVYDEDDRLVTTLSEALEFSMPSPFFSDGVYRSAVNLSIGRGSFVEFTYNPEQEGKLFIHIRYHTRRNLFVGHTFLTAQRERINDFSETLHGNIVVEVAFTELVYVGGGRVSLRRI